MTPAGAFVLYGIAGCVFWGMACLSNHPVRVGVSGFAAALMFLCAAVILLTKFQNL